MHTCRNRAYLGHVVSLAWPFHAISTQKHSKTYKNYVDIRGIYGSKSAKAFILLHRPWRRRLHSLPASEGKLCKMLMKSVS